MSVDVQVYDTLANLFIYPRDDYKERISLCAQYIRDSEKTTEEEKVLLLESFSSFESETFPLTLEDLEELFTRTFDINPTCSLEIGWHLYGESYERGVFMVEMRGLLRKHLIEESVELPDHLSHVLLMIGRMNESDVQEFVTKRFSKALKKMLEGFAEKSNSFEHLLRVVQLLMTHYSKPQAGV